MTNVVFKALPTQALAIAAMPFVDEILVHGSRGPGKTTGQLLAFYKYVGKGFGSSWSGVIFARKYKELDDLVIKAKRYFSKFKDGAVWHTSKSDYYWEWPGGEQLKFRACFSNEDYLNYHGHEYAFIGWNELLNWSTSYLYETFLGCLRSGYKGKERIPLIVYSTANPWGPGKNWVKRRFLRSGINSIIQDDVQIETENGTETISRKLLNLSCSYKENGYLDNKYLAGLFSITDKEKKKAWVNGDWDTKSGGLFDDVWDDNIHVLPVFDIPKQWPIYRSFDWGSSAPFAVCWFALCDGKTSVTFKNSENETIEACPEVGTLIQIYELFGSEDLQSNIGVKWTVDQIAEKIIEVESRLKSTKFIKTNVLPGPADSQIYASLQSDVQTIASRFSQRGISWVPAQKGSGSRIISIELLRTRLNCCTVGGSGLYFMGNCLASIETIPSAPRDADKTDDTSLTIDHAFDAVRYMLMHIESIFKPNFV